MRRSTSALGCLHRLVALLGVALVLTLNLLAVCPEAHRWLHSAEKTAHAACGGNHDPGPSSEDDRCAIVQFSQGVDSLGLAPVLLRAPALARFATLSFPAAFLAATPEHLLPLGCGPPSV